MRVARQRRRKIDDNTLSCRQLTSRHGHLNAVAHPVQPTRPREGTQINHEPCVAGTLLKHYPIEPTPAPAPGVKDAIHQHAAPSDIDIRRAAPGLPCP